MNRRWERGTPIDTLGAARRRDAPPSSLPPAALGCGRAARRPPQHPVKRGGGGGEEAGEGEGEGEGEGTDPAAAVEVVGPVSQVDVVVVSWPDGAGWPQTSARGNFQGKRETLFMSVSHKNHGCMHSLSFLKYFKFKNDLKLLKKEEYDEK